MILTAKIGDFTVEIDEDDFSCEAEKNNWISAMQIVGYKIEREYKKGEVP